ncbi:hypothetical protein [Streptomyces cylindrosporus]|uniref:Uncharacterized protein n=1 Tax=Streptomyces cylindrosporus TaxID=2927583 RepID=A0ABS9Y1F0_9ACTN|nr:hypothetical protein [Streptomyces cylindrosporus]MCI3271037.1 hypothetical protein [Streptomyces cylindrosporus]
MAAEEFLSYVPYRNGEWKDHKTKANVRNVIRANNGRDLRIFVARESNGVVSYTEVAPSIWPAYFREA